MGRKPGTVDDARRYLNGEAARLQSADEVAPLVMMAYLLIQSMVARGVEPLSILAVAASITDHIRADAHKWIATAVDYPADVYTQGVIKLSIEDALDKAEDVGEVVAEMLRGMSSASVEIRDGKLVVTADGGPDDEYEYEHVFEIMVPNAPGSGELN